jgi:hypothetical protein
MLKFIRILKNSTICALPILTNNVYAVEVSILERDTVLDVAAVTLEDKTVSTKSAISIAASPSREDFIFATKYIIPILESRIEYCTQIISFLEGLRALLEKKINLENDISYSIFGVNQHSKKRNRGLVEILNKQIEEKKDEIQEISDIEFFRLQRSEEIFVKKFLTKLIDAKKRDLKGNKIFEKEISKWSTKDNFIESANCLYAHISVAKKHMNTKLFISNGDEELKYVEKFCDNMYYNIILEILSPYCSEKAKTYSSFFIPKDGVTEMGLGNYLGKYKKFFSSIPKSFTIMEDPSESLTERQRIKNEIIQETLKFQEEINNKAREVNEFIASFSSIICTDSSVSDPLAISHGTFARNFVTTKVSFTSAKIK